MKYLFSLETYNIIMKSQWLLGKPWPAVLISLMSTGWCPRSSTLDPAPCKCTCKSSKRWPKCLGSWHPCERFKRNPLLLVSSWFIPTCHSHLGSGIAGGKRSLSLPFILSLFLFFFPSLSLCIPLFM